MQGMLSWIALVCSLVSLRRITTLRQAGRIPTEPAVPHSLQPIREHPPARGLKLPKGFKGWCKRFLQPTSIFTLGILICTIVYTRKMVHYTDATVALLGEQRIANQSNQCTFYIQQRAWLTISTHPRRIMFYPTEKIYEIRYQVLNTGKSKAHNISVHATTFIDDVSQPPERSLSMGEIFLRTGYIHHKLNSEQYADVKDGKKVEVLVRLEYTDSENIQHYAIEKISFFKDSNGGVFFTSHTQDGDSNTHKACHTPDEK